MKSTVVTLSPGNTAVVEVRSLRNAVSGEYMNAATVTCTITDAVGDPLPGEAWPRPLTLITDSTTGDYRALLSHGIEVEVDGEYYYIITAAQDGIVAKWDGVVKVVDRSLV